MKTLLLVIMTALLACACSAAPSKSDAGSQAVEGTPDPVADAGSSTPGTDPATPQDGDAAASPPPAPPVSCVAACEAKYPAAAAKSKKLDATCMLGGSCESVCNDLKAGKNFPPDDTDAGSCDTVGANSYPIMTPSAACSTCLATTPACCTLWISIFGSADGQALNQCANGC